MSDYRLATEVARTVSVLTVKSSFRVSVGEVPAVN